MQVLRIGVDCIQSAAAVVDDPGYVLLNSHPIALWDQRLALICDDPDDPVGTWVHWVLFNIPTEKKGLPAQIAPDAELNDGARHGINDFRKLGYGGPCPPGGTHRYFFKLYALDIALDLESGATKAQVEAAMQGHILGEAQLMGRYKR